MAEQPPVRRPRRRLLSEEDRALWDAVKKSVTPLEKPRPRPAPAPKPPEPVPEMPAPPAAPLPPGKAKRGPAPAVAAAKPAPAPLPAGIDRRTQRALRRGRMDIDDRIDLHGMTQEAAHYRLIGFLMEAHRRRLSVVLVITGKGDGSWDGRGVLKRVVPGWLKVAPVAALVAGFAEAHAYHGGAGALYVRLRRKRP